ncbi:hypothetical protein ACA30_15710 [Virgibacillus soli]|uniref:Uncharacterized protein n=1 Tax=Lederbergia galactosidilytica TaxID=217031 RepID=A0A0Q9Y715_9BACI|nr:hypothetical protein ACA29_18105 [Lederbergia galactosidilytica]KRG13344.1 hypothetical protein ACA30_15710 [Virgibacillus soli]
MERVTYIDTWQFWLTLFLVLGPLIVLLFTINHEKIFLLGFYGWSIHVWFGYIDTAYIYLGYVNYPYYLFPFFHLFHSNPH